MDTLNYDNIITECLTICDNINDDNVEKFFPKFDKCLESSNNVGSEKILLQKSLLGLVRKCRQDFLRETKMSFRDVTQVANYFSEYIRDLMHLDGIEVNQNEFFSQDHNCHIDKRASSYKTSFQSVKSLNILIIFLILLIILMLITCLLCYLTTRICVQLQGNTGECALKIPKDVVDNLTLTCREMGLDPNEIKVLREKTCFDREYESIINKYLHNRSESSGALHN